MFWVYLFLMIAGFVGIIICKKKQKTFAAAQGLAVVCFIPIIMRIYSCSSFSNFCSS